jgi:hypothetical protein
LEAIAANAFRASFFGAVPRLDLVTRATRKSRASDGVAKTLTREDEITGRDRVQQRSCLSTLVIAAILEQDSGRRSAASPST